MITEIGIAALLVIMAMSFFLVSWKGYKDGILGHLALIFMGGSSALVLLDVCNGGEYEYQPLTVGVFGGVALFMSRHTWNAWRFRNQAEQSAEQVKQ